MGSRAPSLTVHWQTQRMIVNQMQVCATCQASRASQKLPTAVGTVVTSNFSRILFISDQTQIFFFQNVTQG